jgi:GTP-binding protein EngB required for normal cell division
MSHTKNIWKTKHKQFGFLPGRSKMDAIFHVMDEWERAMDNDQAIHAVFFDFAKAFDLVNYRILFKKMDKILPK